MSHEKQFHAGGDFLENGDHGLRHRLPVAKLEDVMRGKVWAAGDPGRRASKRQKDLADIARLLEGHPELRPLVPQPILQRLIE